MSLSRVKTWIPAEILTASDLNAEFNSILNNALSLISPLTGALDFDGKELILDGDGDSSLTADTDDRLDLKLQGVDLFRWIATVASAVNGLDFIARDSGSPASIQAQGSDSNVALDIRDDNANELLIFAAVASAINELTITNAAAGSEPSIAATGGDTDIDVNLIPKGAGLVTSAGAALAIISTVQDWTAAQSGQVTGLSDGANIALDLSLSNNFSVTLGGDRTLDNPSNDIAGTSGVITVTQDGGAPRTLSYGNQYEFIGGNAPVLSTSNGDTDTLYYYVEAADKILISSGFDWS